MTKNFYSFLIFAVILAVLFTGDYLHQHYGADHDITQAVAFLISTILAFIAAKSRKNADRSMEMPTWQWLGIMAFVALLIGIGIVSKKEFGLNDVSQIIMVVVSGMILVAVFGNTRLFRNPALEARGVLPPPPEPEVSSDESLVISLEPRIAKLQKESNYHITKRGVRWTLLFALGLAGTLQSFLQPNPLAHPESTKIFGQLFGGSLAFAILGALAIMTLDRHNARTLLGYYKHGEKPVMTLTPRGITCPIILFPTFPGINKIHNYLRKSGRTSLTIYWKDIKRWQITRGLTNNPAFVLRLSPATLSQERLSSTGAMVFIKDFSPEKEQEILDFSRRFLAVPMEYAPRPGKRSPAR